MNTVEREKLQDLIGDFSDAMLVTVDAMETLQGRPMHIAEHDESAGTLVFASSVDSGKVDEIQAHSHSCVTMQGGGKYVSLSGVCSISQDRDRIQALWNKAWEVWFPDGPGQPDLCLIVFRPASGEYWDNSGVQGLKYLWKAATALASDSTPETDGPAMHGSTNL